MNIYFLSINITMVELLFCVAVKQTTHFVVPSDIKKPFS